MAVAVGVGETVPVAVGVDVAVGETIAVAVGVTVGVVVAVGVEQTICQTKSSPWNRPWSCCWIYSWQGRRAYSIGLEHASKVGRRPAIKCASANKHGIEARHHRGCVEVKRNRSVAVCYDKPVRWDPVDHQIGRLDG